MNRTGRWAGAVVLIAAASVLGQEKNGRSVNARLTPTQIESLPLITSFQTQKSDRFFVDLENASDGHPFLGKRSSWPHGGGHVYFNNTQGRWPQRPDSPTTYPAIYAAADGYIAGVTSQFRLTTGADRYGVDLAFAHDGNGRAYKLHLSIEPFIPEPAPGFYDRFIRVQPGQAVKKGEVIAYMYVPEGQENTHIHFCVMKMDGGKFQAPAIFTTKVVEQFHACWKKRGHRHAEGGVMPPCMGYRLEPEENPLTGEAVDAL